MGWFKVILNSNYSKISKNILNLNCKDVSTVNEPRVGFKSHDNFFMSQSRCTKMYPKIGVCEGKIWQHHSLGVNCAPIKDSHKSLCLQIPPGKLSLYVRQHRQFILNESCLYFQIA
jgi:hypothetical protein